MTGSFERIIRSFSPSSAAPSRPVRFAACCAIRSASCGSMRSDGANRRAAPNRWCSTRSAIGDLVHMVLDRALRDLEAGGGLAAADAETDRSGGGPRRASRRRRLGKRASGPADRHLGPHPRRRPPDGGPRPVLWRRCSAGARSYGEVPFGGSEPKSDARRPYQSTGMFATRLFRSHPWGSLPAPFGCRSPACVDSPAARRRHRCLPLSTEGQ